MHLGLADQHVGGQVIVVVQQDVGFDAAFGAAAQGNRLRHRLMVVESSDSSLFLKRNVCVREPS